jgi:hypothetical protein
LLKQIDEIDRINVFQAGRLAMRDGAAWLDGKRLDAPVVCGCETKEGA